ncbi:MAG: hypothetical protein EHM71_17480 [Zetaproteobacteria bacterium]|nr:MAG: hypothetical protein EHM71_17480 [Zetaproteobacteria bacterium]
MANRLLLRVIGGASDTLACAVYRRIVDDRRAAAGHAVPSGIAETWEQIVASAMEERILNPAEATTLLAELRHDDVAAIPL